MERSWKSLPFSLDSKLAKARKMGKPPGTLGLKKFGPGKIWVNNVWTQNTCILAFLHTFILISGNPTKTQNILINFLTELDDFKKIDFRFFSNFLGQKSFYGQTSFLGKKVFWVKKAFGSKKFFGSTKFFLGQKSFFGSKKFFG